jgi:hypothetical protein
MNLPSLKVPMQTTPKQLCLKHGRQSDELLGNQQTEMQQHKVTA